MPRHTYGADCGLQPFVNVCVIQVHSATYAGHHAIVGELPNSAVTCLQGREAVVGQPGRRVPFGYPLVEAAPINSGKLVLPPRSIRVYAHLIALSGNGVVERMGDVRKCGIRKICCRTILHIEVDRQGDGVWRKAGFAKEA